LASFFIALILSLAITFLLLKILPFLGILDHPNERKIHLKAVPRMGGFGIYCAFVAPMLLLHYFDNTQKGIIIGAGIAMLIGILDDIKGVPALIKLIALLLLTLLLKQYGIVSTLPFHKIGLDNNITNILVSMLWIVGITSAMNALDHMDGLAAGISFIACLSYLAVSIQMSNFFWGLLAVSLAGSLLGFLCFNWNPAKIFMGDSGSFFIGFTLAATGLMGGWSSNPLKATIIPILILSLPIVDLAYVLISRYKNGTTKSIAKAITYCGKDHIGHRIMKVGLSQKSSAGIILFFSATISISALKIRSSTVFESLLLFLQVGCMYFVFLFFLRKLELRKL
jgi:UDP-GlcNAc:undecaprenyl-phosphate GlcNAc-1-phosphate transferase